MLFYHGSKARKAWFKVKKMEGYYSHQKDSDNCIVSKSSLSITHDLTIQHVGTYPSNAFSGLKLSLSFPSHTPPLQILYFCVNFSIFIFMGI